MDGLPCRVLRARLGSLCVHRDDVGVMGVHMHVHGRSGISCLVYDSLSACSVTLSVV